MDIEKTIAFTVSDLLKSLSESAVKSANTSYTKLFKEKGNFQKFVRNNYSRYSKSQTLIYNEPHSIEDMFVMPRLKVEGGVLEIPTISKIDTFSKRILIHATAGAGKSMLLKYIFMHIIQDRKDTIPFFIEFRRLNGEPSEHTLLDLIKSDLALFGLHYSRQDIQNFLASGKFSLLLDGFDELEIKKREPISKEIVQLSKIMADSLIIITTRPDEDIRSLENFSQIRVSPLEREKAVQLIKLIKYDETVKSKFILELEKDLYEKRKDFLSNPLLLTIMLITYSESAEIPEKLSIFYDHAFDALFFKHDAKKEIFKREHYSTLAIDDFKLLLSYFSFLSYKDDDISFSSSKFNRHIDAAKKISQVKVKTDDFRSDLLRTVCIINADGLQYAYTHRSFQEYFTALCLTKLSPTIRPKALAEIAKKSARDNVLTLYMEMDRNSLERDLVLPTMSKTVEKISQLKDENEKLNYFSKAVGILSFRIIKRKTLSGHRNTRQWLLDTDMNSIWLNTKSTDEQTTNLFIRRAYGDIYPKLAPKNRNWFTDSRIRKAVRSFDLNHFDLNNSGPLLTLSEFNKKTYKINFMDNDSRAYLDALGITDFMRREMRAYEKYYGAINERNLSYELNLNSLF